MEESNIIRCVGGVLLYDVSKSPMRISASTLMSKRLTTYYNAGIKPIDFPPLLPTPGSIVDGPEQRLGVMWPTHNLPRYMGKSFSTICKMQTTMQEVAAVYLTQPTLPVQNVPLAFVEAKYQNLLAWTDTLNNEMIQSDGSPDSVVIFQLVRPWYMQMTYFRKRYT